MSKNFGFDKIYVQTKEFGKFSFDQLSDVISDPVWGENTVYKKWYV